MMMLEQYAAFGLILLPAFEENRYALAPCSVHSVLKLNFLKSWRTMYYLLHVYIEKVG